MRTRFAPSPTGYLHLGHAYSAWFSEAAARAEGGEFLLRIEDIDVPRCREEFVAAIEEDLQWLGIAWDGEVVRQSDRLDRYHAALQTLTADGLTYPCFCTRKQIQEEVARAGHAPHAGEILYPGTCRGLSADERAERIAAGEEHAIRLDHRAAFDQIGGRTLFFEDKKRGRQAVDISGFGDVVLARKDIGTSYHMAVVIDDAAQGISLVTRGVDLFEATGIHRLLQELLQLPEPQYWHHELIEGTDGKRLAKRDGAPTIRSLREAGENPEELRSRLSACNFY